MQDKPKTREEAELLAHELRKVYGEERVKIVEYMKCYFNVEISFAWNREKFVMEKESDDCRPTSD